VYLRSNGATVEVTDDPERATYRTSLGIPESAASCHTAVIDGYAIEGHVPAEAIDRLLTDRPDATGLSVPGMPADSPGMGGDAASWAAQAVLLIERDQSLTPYSY
jgi:hypothetical protein